MKVEEINEIKVNNIPAYPLEVNNNPLEDETKAPEIYDEDKRHLIILGENSKPKRRQWQNKS